ncbi:MAG TPA: hypothetical protein VHY08_24330 [Bacillota bacterium]|nr:hypothetical protein [Bacillota bacterium]
MSQPKAIYASIPPVRGGGAEWIGTQPVVVANPYPFWPNLEWTGDNIGVLPITEYTEVPQYLWLQPVADPVNTVTGIFTRRWTGTWCHGGFTPRAIEEDRYDIIIYIAADDQYLLSLRRNGAELQPSGFNANVPIKLPWRNVKVYEYEGICINCRTILELQTEVTNIGQGPGALPDNNPAMFTWVMLLVED